MHAVARFFGKGLGHERRFHALPVGHCLDHALVRRGIVAGRKRIGLMAQSQFKLSGGIFGYG